MNKAFVREPELDGQAYCPRCKSLGVAVGKAVLDALIQPAARGRLGESAWFCEFARCEAAYFDQLERVVEVGELVRPVYPKDPSASICACFPFTLDEIEADLRDGVPTRIRALLAQAKSPAARCSELAADGHCCMTQVQRLYMRGLADRGG